LHLLSCLILVDDIEELEFQVASALYGTRAHNWPKHLDFFFLIRNISQFNVLSVRWRYVGE